MEADRLSPDIPEPAASEDRSSSSSSPRTFDCTYCKRGFSNAQALGGHMNIHRKNRAKIIKQPSALAQLSLDIHSNPFPSYPSAPTSYVPQLSHGSDDGSCSLKWQSVLPREHDVHRATHLSLLAETQSGAGDQSSISSHERKMEERSGHGADAAEVDLELRLGLEPPDATMGKKGFV